MRKESTRIRSTTVLLVRKDDHVALAGDGQVTLGETIMKATAKKVRRLYNDRILPASPAQPPTLFAADSVRKQVGAVSRKSRAGRDRAKQGMAHRQMLRHLEALLVVADDKSSFLFRATET